MLVKERRPTVEYYVDHAHGQFYIFTNDSENKEFKVFSRTARVQKISSGRVYVGYGCQR